MKGRKIASNGNDNYWHSLLLLVMQASKDESNSTYRMEAKLT